MTNADAAAPGTHLALPLTTPRLILRRFQPSDAEAFAAYRNDSEVARFQGWPLPFTAMMAAAFINGMQNRPAGTPGEWVQIALEHQADGRLLGDVAFLRHSGDPRLATVGFTLAREAWGQGFGTEAVGALVDALFSTFNLHRIRADCDPRNDGSARLLIRLGFRQEGQLVESFWDERVESWLDELYFGLLRREWLQRRSVAHIPSVPARPWHSLVRALAARRVVSAVLARLLPPVDQLLLARSGNRISATSLLSGLPVITVTTTGRRSGRARRVPLLPIVDTSGRLALIASNFGRANHPAWYHNMLAHPFVIVRHRHEVRSYRVQEVHGEQREAFLRRAEAIYPGYRLYRERAQARRIPVLLLSPVATP